MGNFWVIIGLVGPLSLVVALWVLSVLSQRIGAVRGRAKTYRGFYVSIALILVSICIRLLMLGTPLEGNQDVTLLYLLPLVSGLVLAVVVGSHYWGWLLNERNPTSNHDHKIGKVR
jgi:hypothetical protein